MFKNYLVIALRNIFKHKLYTCINIMGLALGMASVIMILLWIGNELSYDKFLDNHQSMYRIVERFNNPGKRTDEIIPKAPFPAAEALRTEFPDLKIVRLHQLFNHTPLIKYLDKEFYEDNLFFVDSSFFDVFSFPLVTGDAQTALSKPFSMVITEDVAEKYFGDEDPMGKMINIENHINYEVTGILDNIPSNSHMRFDFLASMSNIDSVFSIVDIPTSWLQLWYWTACYTYILFPEQMNPAVLERQFPQFVQNHYPEIIRDELTLSLQPITDIHLHSHLEEEIKRNGDIKYIYIFSIIAVATLLIACVNFINLTTARAVERAKEIGLRKVFGAHRRKLAVQFLTESMILSLISAIIAVAVLELFMAQIVQLLDMELNPGILSYSILIIVSIVMITGVGAGCYPAVYLSRFNPIGVLRSALKPRTKGINIRRILIGLQFVASIILIVSAITIYRQVQYMQNKELGFEKENIVQFKIKGTGLNEQREAFKNQLLQNPAILNVSFAATCPGLQLNINPYRVDGIDESVDLPGIFVDYDFLETFNIELKWGRNFSKEIRSDLYSADSAHLSGGAFILNETAVRWLGWNNAEGKKMTYNLGVQMGNVIGVVKDFNYRPLRQQIGPLVLSIAPHWFNKAFVRIHPDRESEALVFIESAWNSFVPDHPFNYSFIDEELKNTYSDEDRLGKIILIFSALAIMIAALGVLGLITFSTRQRTKEIGIRKVVGASIRNISSLLLKEFVLIIALAGLIAGPIAYGILNRWLADYAYHVNVNLVTLVMSILVVLLISLITVGFTIIKAARSNPIEAIRYE